MAQGEEEFPANTEVFKGNPDEVLRHWARKSDDSDLINASQDKCAKDVGADYIITCNVRDFENSEVPAITPYDFIEMCK